MARAGASIDVGAASTHAHPVGPRRPQPTPSRSRASLLVSRRLCGGLCGGRCVRVPHAPARDPRRRVRDIGSGADPLALRRQGPFRPRVLFVPILLHVGLVRAGGRRGIFYRGPALALGHLGVQRNGLEGAGLAHELEGTGLVRDGLVLHGLSRLEVPRNVNGPGKGFAGTRPGLAILVVHDLERNVTEDFGVLALGLQDVVVLLQRLQQLVEEADVVCVLRDGLKEHIETRLHGLVMGVLLVKVGVVCHLVQKVRQDVLGAEQRSLGIREVDPATAALELPLLFTVPINDFFDLVLGNGRMSFIMVQSVDNQHPAVFLDQPPSAKMAPEKCAHLLTGVLVAVEHVQDHEQPQVRGRDGPAELRRLQQLDDALEHGGALTGGADACNPIVLALQETEEQLDVLLDIRIRLRDVQQVRHQQLDPVLPGHAFVRWG
mmetsp:Transcript_28777/g.46461  ORF Transcript_28777/g.46461 Transcript_28777/m.46461 type:complete len:434 (-) Transcript_28777:318-1619(-)